MRFLVLWVFFYSVQTNLNVKIFTHPFSEIYLLYHQKYSIIGISGKKRSIIPTDPRMQLEIIEIYDYYDQPILFACKNAADHLHLVVAADENDQHETWLYVRVSAERLNLIRSGTIDLHDAFADSENGHLLQVKFSYDNPASPQIEHLESNQIPEDMLPTPGECLNLETETFPMLSKTEPTPKSNLTLELHEHGLKS